MVRLAAFILLASALVRAQAPAPTTGTLDFLVATNKNKPVPAATVTFAGPEGKTYSGATNADGHLRVADLAPGVYSFRAFNAPGYRRDNSNFLEDFSIHAGNTRQVNFHLVRIEPIQGTVTDQDGKPIEGATVVWLSRPTSPTSEPQTIATASTDARGYYSMTQPEDPDSFLNRLRVAIGMLPVLPGISPPRPFVKVLVSPERALQLGRAYEEASTEDGYAPGQPMPLRKSTDPIHFSLRPAGEP